MGRARFSNAKFSVKDYLLIQWVSTQWLTRLRLVMRYGSLEFFLNAVRSTKCRQFFNGVRGGVARPTA